MIKNAHLEMTFHEIFYKNKIQNLKKNVFKTITFNTNLSLLTVTETNKQTKCKNKIRKRIPTKTREQTNKTKVQKYTGNHRQNI